MQKKLDRINVRITKDLKRQLQQQADQHKRKLSDYICLLLENASCQEWANTHKVATPTKAIFDL